MQRVFNLQNIGIETPLNLEGDLRILREEKGLPIVFLFDEHHENLNNCIDKNKENARELIDKGSIKLVGVESFAGGKAWDYDKQTYDELYLDRKFDECFIKLYKSNCILFADCIIKINPNLITGVECWGMMRRIPYDFTEGKKYFGKEIATHHLHKERSKHFIETLFEKRNRLNLDGNLILNCGSNHNTHIEEWINSGEIDEIAKFRANYVRINTID